MKISHQIGVCAVFAGLAATAFAQQTPVATYAGQLNPLVDLRASDLKSFSERPLFSPSRRPPKTIEETTDTEPAEIVQADSELTLLGVTFGPDGSVARISSAGEAASQSLKEGDTIDGWRIEVIDASSVTMRRGEESRMLTIFNNQAPGMLELEAGDSDGVGPGIVLETEASEEAPAVRLVQPN